ncbi:MAG: hypothetical protein IJF83_05855 [Methanobrevibacter sp.]|nr:hypothetical protein [Methanobrevibacter sp.]
MTDCPPIYNNPQMESFGEQKYVTQELLEIFGCNDEYLLQLARKIEYLTPPAVRKRFILQDSIDTANSYGCIVNGEHLEFDNNREKRVFVDFSDLSLIDNNKTTAYIRQFVQTDESNNKSIVKQCVVPLTDTSTVHRDTRNYSPWTIRDPETGDIISDDMTCNEFWYIGFDKNRHYETRPNWLENKFNGEIPGICRAQTFKALHSGKLESIVLNLQGTNNTGMPLRVDIRKTKLEDGVYVPAGTHEWPHLASKDVIFTNTNPGVTTITFDNPPEVEEGETYAITLLSPLSHHTNCYWVGGWNKHCHADVYEDGNAFYSWNSGYNWIRYGKDDAEVDYHWGQYAPQDFAFQCNIREITQVYKQNTDYYLYLKPILSNPVTRIELNCDDTIADSSTTIVYQVSNDGVNWTTVGDSHIVDFATPAQTTFIRAKLKTTTNATPIIDNITAILTTTAAPTMYARSHYYLPKAEGILSADVWGRIYSPWSMDPTVSCEAEIISNKEVREAFQIIEADDLVNYVWIEELDKEAIESSQNLTQYIRDNPEVIDILKQHQVYVLSFFTELEFVSSPAYPLIDVNLQPTATGVKNKSLSEWYDFTVDYDTDILTFRNHALSNLIRGTITIKYNPLFLQHITNTEIGVRNTNKATTDGDLNEEGLILDYFKETLIVSEENVETRRISLRTTPVDPIRHLYYNGKELAQDIDYTIDFNTHEIVFPIVNTNNESSILNINDTIEVIYTPDIDDNGIAIGWYATRSNLLKQVDIEPYYIEYKA